MWAGGNRHHCRDWDGRYTGVDLIQVSMPTRKQRRAGGQLSPTPRRFLSAEESSLWQRANFESSEVKGRKGRKGNHGRCMAPVALHCIQRRLAPHVESSPHRTTLLRRDGRANVPLFVFLLFCIFHFLFENHHSITESGSRFSHAFLMRVFLNLPLIMKENKYSALEAWVRVKKITEIFALGWRFCFAFRSLIFFFFSVSPHVQGQHNGIGGASWNHSSSFDTSFSEEVVWLAEPCVDSECRG